uniref:Uncharacterized protein n=1 Tax=Neogobius melanostomus TaxID=47308 RepID=A0A8C6UK84_9GOBI
IGARALSHDSIFIPEETPSKQEDAGGEHTIQGNAHKRTEQKMTGDVVSGEIFACDAF